MNSVASYREQLKTLIRDAFGGAEVRPVSGVTHLMNLRWMYFEQIVTPQLSQILSKFSKSDTSAKIFQMAHKFFSVAFQALYHCRFPEISFFQLGGLSCQPFWVAQHFYFLKTIPEICSVEITVDRTVFRFNPNSITKSSDKIPRLSYSFAGLEDDIVVIEVVRSRKSWKGTKHLTQQIRQAGINISQNDITMAIRYFEQHLEVDFFIAKNPRNLLLQLFQIWLFDMISRDELRERDVILKTFEDLSRAIIELIAPFEEALTKVWNQPRNVNSSHYVITLDKIAARFSGLLAKIFQHPGMKHQFSEWVSLDLIGSDVQLEEILFNSDSSFPQIKEEYGSLPLDTQHFPDLEDSIIGAFDHLDDELDGWLVHSENYQALNTLREKFNNSVKTIYIDPPFNKDYNAGFSYSVNFSDNAWVTLLDNRFRLARDLLCVDGSMWMRCDSSGNMYARQLMNEIFGRENFRNEIHVRRFRKNAMNRVIRRLPAGLDTIFVYSKSDAFAYTNPVRPRERPRKGFWRHMNDSSGAGSPKTFFGRTISPPDGKHWKYSQRRIDKMIDEGHLILQCRQCGHIHSLDDGVWNGCSNCGADDPVPRYWVHEKNVDVLDSNWSDIYGYSTTWGFQTENSEPLLQRVIETSSQPGDVIMDFFLGSGTTIAVAHKLRRRWLGIEMGDHFYTTVLPRMKRVLAGEQSGISNAVDWRGGGFFKYESIEQYWDVVGHIRLDQFLR